MTSAAASCLLEVSANEGRFRTPLVRCIVRAPIFFMEKVRKT
jgi:hypothetical protein